MCVSLSCATEKTKPDSELSMLLSLRVTQHHGRWRHDGSPAAQEEMMMWKLVEGYRYLLSRFYEYPMISPTFNSYSYEYRYYISTCTILRIILFGCRLRECRMHGMHHASPHHQRLGVQYGSDILKDTPRCRRERPWIIISDPTCSSNNKPQR